MRKILLVDDNSTIVGKLAKQLKRRGYEVQTAATVAEAREMLDRERLLFISSDLDLPDGTGLELLEKVRAMDAALPFLIVSCHSVNHYEAEAIQRGATLCLDKTKVHLVTDKLIEYAYLQSCEEPNRVFHKLLYVHADRTDSSNGLQSGILSAAMLQKGFYIVTVETLAGANDHLLEDSGIELILCDTILPDGTGLDLFRSQQHLAEQYGDLIEKRPFFILTDSHDLATEYQYRQEGVNDYLTSPINIPELIRRIRYFVEP